MNRSTTTPRTLRRVVALAVAVVAFMLTATAPASAAPAPTSPSAGRVAMKVCATAPEPARPSANLPGSLYARPATATSADPFTDDSVNIADVYGYGYKWTTYDTGCLPGSDIGIRSANDMANFLLASAASINAAAAALLSYVITPTWLEPLDNVLTEATAAIKKGFFTPWLTIILLLVAAGMLIAASRSNVSSLVTTGGWAMLIMVATTWVMSYPVSSAQAVDGLIQETVTTTANATGSGQPGDENASAAQRSLDSQIDTINRETLYANWLDGVLGSSDSATARKYGPALFKASHLTWDEEATLDADPQAGQAIIEAKKQAWEDAAAEVESSDPTAYQQLTGNNFRWNAAWVALIQALITMPFMLVGGFLVLVAYTVIRVLVPLAPALGVFGMLNLARGWVTSVMSNVARFIIMGPAFWAGALVNLLMTSAVLRSELPFAVKFALALAMPILLFKILMPGARTGAGFMVRELVHQRLNRNSIKKGFEDADVHGWGDPTRHATPQAAPVAEGAPTTPGTDLALAPQHAPRPTFFVYPEQQQPIVPDPPRAPEQVATAQVRPQYGDPTPQPAPRSRHELARGTGAPTSAAETRTTFVPLDDDTRALPASTTSTNPGTEVNPWVAARQHPQATTDPDTSSTPSTVAGGDDLSAPATTAPQIIARDATLNPDVVEARADENGVFQIWTPPEDTTDSTGSTPDERHA